MYKKIIPIFNILVLLLSCQDNNNNSHKQLSVIPNSTTDTFSSIHINDTLIDVGMIKCNQKVSRVCYFSNPSHVPLRIIDVRTNCGCTIADWNKKPILLNKQDSILIHLNIKDKGLFKKSIVIRTNTQSVFHIVHVKGNAT